MLLCSVALRARVMGLLGKYKRQLLNFAAVLALASILLWPAYVNGEPFYMTDTSSYLRGADAAAHWLTGHRTVWTDELFHRYGANPQANGPNSPRGDVPVVLAGRSIYYGLLLYLCQFLGNFWALAILQAVLVSSSIAITIDVLQRPLNRKPGSKPLALRILLLGTCLAAFTPVAYFASYLMPDIFGALGLLAFAQLAFLWKQNGRATRAFWFVLLLAAMLFHTANFLLIGLLTASPAASVALKLAPPKAQFPAIGLALVLAIMGQAFFTWSVKHATGAAPVRPPFVAARIIDDGPGYDYLRENCPEAKLVFCRATSFRTKISDSLLWSQDPHLSIFQALSPSEQRLASAQQKQFILDVLADRPLQLMQSSAAAIFRQATHFDLVSFNYTPQNIEYFTQKLPKSFLDQARLSRAFRGNMPVRFVEWSTVVAVLASLLVISRTLFMDVRQNGRLSSEGSWVAALVLGVLLNAAVCGALSTPKGRYQMRLIWVLPLAALVTLPRRKRVVVRGTMGKVRSAT